MHDGAPREDHVFLHHADGHRIPVLVRAAPMYDVAGRIVGAVETISDNSELVNALKRIHELDDASHRDPLAGVGNRRFAELKLESGLLEFRGHGLPARTRAPGPASCGTGPVILTNVRVWPRSRPPGPAAS